MWYVTTVGPASQKAPCYKWFWPGKVKTASSLFTNDASSFDNSTSYNTHTVIMHAYEVQICCAVCVVLKKFAVGEGRFDLVEWGLF